ncbi:MAG: VWA domain-containing protein [Rhodanobacter sp.]|nr:MAG: VWA domain-containing protein [Rhodanobacter sp.]TAM15087.1 MAG: VWA domain-containing protein [Rhodanobacter sp.]TAM36443.1 MAG: VWA domain-containing protein [Rhodanobacter sp.]
MMGASAAFHFLRPWWLLGLLLLPWIVWSVRRRQAGWRSLARLVDAALLPSVVQGRALPRRAPPMLAALAWLLATLALAGPTWSRVASPLYTQRAAQVVAISLSQRMLSHDVAPSRIDRARLKAHALLMANRAGLNALIGYAGEAFVVAPLTSDVHSLGTLLDAMAPDTMPVDGNDAAAAIKQGVSLIRDAKAGSGTIVLLTDAADAAAQAAAREARAAGVRVAVLGVGTPQGAPVPLPGGGFLHDAKGNLQLAGRNDAALAALAAAGDGRYVPMSSDDGDVAALHADLQTGRTKSAAGTQGDAWQERGPWLLLPVLLLAALAFQRGWLVLLALVLLPALPMPAQAASWRDLWQRPDQQAAAALARGDAKQALMLARDPAWRGAAAYRAGEYAAAAKVLQKAPGSDGAYNRGNALAREGKFADAIHAYDEALKRDPKNADAMANRKAVEDWLRQHQPPKQSPKSSSSQGQGKPSNGQGKQPQSQGPGNQQKPPSGADQAAKDNRSQGSGDAGKPAPSQANGAAKPDAGKSDKRPPFGKGPDQPPPTPAQQAPQQAQAARAQQALKQQLDRQLGAAQPAKPAAPTHELGANAADDTSAKLPPDLRDALRRVPDDPGALLRRKFELEYQERHGGVPDAGGQ